MIHFYLGLLLVSFLLTSITVIPFINLLYKLKFQRQKQKTLDFQNKATPIFDKFHAKKVGTPVGGGLLIILAVSILFFIVFPLLRANGIFVSSNYHIEREIFVIFFSFFSFAAIGLYDDILKFFGFEKTGFFGLRMRHKLFFTVCCGRSYLLFTIFLSKHQLCLHTVFGGITLGSNLYHFLYHTNCHFC